MTPQEPEIPLAEKLYNLLVVRGPWVETNYGGVDERECYYCRGIHPNHEPDCEFVRVEKEFFEDSIYQIRGIDGAD